MHTIIGITTGEINNTADPWSPITYGQSHTYSDAIIRAGGLPILIPITEDIEVLKKIYEVLDGLLLAGGNDINPALYGQLKNATTGEISDRRDAVETHLFKWALEDGKPIFGICRGMQLFNTVLGGTLYQDIDSELSNMQDHSLSSKEQDGTHIAHVLKVEPASQFAKTIGSDSIQTNTHHHQAIKDVAPSLRAVGWAEDGIIEAVEGTDSSFLLGVQCHPESLQAIEPKWELVFEAFIAATKK